MGTFHVVHQRFIRTALAAILLASATSALADDTASKEWGTASGARSAQPDSKGRSGHWWWPRKARDTEKSAPTAGNKGRIYGKLSSVAAQPEMPVEVAPPMVQPQPPIVCGHVILNNLLFHSDNVELRPEGIAEIQKVIAEMTKFPGDTVTCVGHTDDTGPEAYNHQLGLRRAQAVVDYMKANGIAAERVKAESKGETNPAVPNDSPANRALNRRVVFQYKLGN